MNKSLRHAIILFVLFFGLIGGISIYSRWFRTRIYIDEKHTVQKLGKVYSEKTDRFELVNKNDQNDVKIVTPEDLHNYDKTLYDITFVPANTSLDYVVGYFRGWEDIQNTNDKYLLLDTGVGILEKYRFIEDNRMILNMSKSSFNVESIYYKNLISPGTEKMYPAKLVDLGIEKLVRVLKNGDGVVLFPRYFENGTVFVDQDEVPIINVMSVRRVFGINEIRIETLF